MSAMIPAPRCPITIRPATMADIPFIDSLQKLHKKQVGFLHRGTLEGKIEAGHVLVAWAARPCSSEQTQDTGEPPVLQPLGYCIGTDKYFKHEDIGIIYHLNVVRGKQRHLIGASLVKAQFEK